MRGSKKKAIVERFIRETGRAPTPYVVRAMKHGLSVEDAIRTTVNQHRSRYLHEDNQDAAYRAYMVAGGGFGPPVKQTLEALELKARIERGEQVTTKP